MKKVIEWEIIQNDLLQNISEKYNIDYNLLLEELNNITITKTLTSKYHCDHSFFSRENELSFYWAGFIAADGCVYKRSLESKQLIISLADKDLNHLEEFKKHINYDGYLVKKENKHSKTNPAWNDSTLYSIRISSSQIFNDLKKFNICPNKTKIYTFPENIINHPLINHFMRGYVDGDGSFMYDTNRDRVLFELRGTFEFLSVFSDILNKNCKIRHNSKVTTPDSTSKIKHSGKQVLPEIVSFLYKDANFFLKRKKEIAFKCFDCKILRNRYVKNSF